MIYIRIQLKVKTENFKDFHYCQKNLVHHMIITWKIYQINNYISQNVGESDHMRGNIFKIYN